MIIHTRSFVLGGNLYAALESEGSGSSWKPVS